MKSNKAAYLLIMLVLVYGGYKYLDYKNDSSHKLKDVGYSDEEIEIIEDKLNNSKIEQLKEDEYNESVALLVNEKHFIEDKLQAYIDYQKENKDYNISDIISVVNAGADKDFYSEIKNTDTSKGNLILVNKFYKLEDDFTVDDLIPINTKYATRGRFIKQEVFDNFFNMWSAAKELGLNLIISSGYRTNESQKTLYINYSNKYGQAEADTFSARPGHSEHQTGLTIDLSTSGSSIDDFEQTTEYTWTKDNAHKYGFILRYPENKEHITGYDFEPWHYRYVGKDVAKEVYDLNITFDEYYELFIK